MKVLIAGGAGFIGSYITKELVSRGDEVIIVDALLNYVSPFDRNYKISDDVLNRKWSIQELLEIRFGQYKDKVKFIRGDIRHKARFAEILSVHSPNKIICLAAIPLASESNIFTEDAFSTNTSGTVNILEVLSGVVALKEFELIEQFIYTSSSMVYGDFQYFPCDEKHPTNPTNIYGGTKLSGEILTKVFSHQKDIPYTIIRPSAVYGPTDINRRVSQLFLQNALNGKPLILHDEGRSKLDFTYVKDIARGYVLALDRPEAIGQTFNITRGEGRSLKEYVEILKKYIPDITVEMKKSKLDEKRPERGALDISKARKLLGYNPQYSLEDGVKEYYEYVINNEKPIDFYE